MNVIKAINGRMIDIAKIQAVAACEVIKLVSEKIIGKTKIKPKRYFDKR